MRGKKLSKDSRKWDAILIAARYGADGRLSLTQGYLRRGEVWGDKQLLDREALIEALRQGRRIAVGAPTDIPGEFSIEAPVHLKQGSGGEILVVNGAAASRDALKLPPF